MKAHSAASAAIVLAIVVAGCAQNGTLNTPGLNTSSINQGATTAQMPKADPNCVTLAAQIDTLNKEGIPAKVSKAASKKYKMKSADLAKADALNKAHAQFQANCSSYPPSPVVAEIPTPKKTATKVAAKKSPPVPSQKPVAAAMVPKTPEALGQKPSGPIGQQQSAATQP
jgi:hypothetical protein